MGRAKQTGAVSELYSTSIWWCHENRYDLCRAAVPGAFSVVNTRCGRGITAPRCGLASFKVARPSVSIPRKKVGTSSLRQHFSCHFPAPTNRKQPQICEDCESHGDWRTREAAAHNGADEGSAESRRTAVVVETPPPLPLRRHSRRTQDQQRQPPAEL